VVGLKRIREVVGAFVAKARNIGIVKKMIVGYFVIIFLPILVFGWMIYNQFYESVVDEYVEGRQQLIEQAHSNFKVNLAQAESTYELIQSNTNIVEYLSGMYQTDSEQVYAYLKYIEPMLTYMTVGNPFLEDIKIYSMHEGVMENPSMPRIASMDARSVEPMLLPGKGVWTMEPQSGGVPALTYYQTIYNMEYSKALGILEVSLRASTFRQLFDALGEGSGSEFLLLGAEHAIVYRTSLANVGEESLHDLIRRFEGSPERYFYMPEHTTIVNSVRLTDVDTRLVWLAKDPELFDSISGKRHVLVAGLVTLLVILSFIYYMIASSLTKRILHLAKHMRKVDSDNLKLYAGPQDQDEIGMLAVSFNALMERIDELVNNVHRAELLRKEAAYLVLQAQIKPHFLYNTLESIRMMAEMKGEADVADICYAFGKFMRYSLSSNQRESTLAEELEHAGHFIRIHKLRMGERFASGIDLDEGLEHFRCPRFLLQPIVENAIVHGLSNVRGQGRLHIRVQERGGFVVVTVSDNGRGIPAERLERIRDMLHHRIDIKDFQTDDGGHGIYNINQRIKAFYGDGSELSIENGAEGGTTCVLTLAKGGDAACSA